MEFIGKTVLMAGERCEITAAEINKRGKTMLIVRKPDGAAAKIDARYADFGPQFAPADPTALTRPLGDYYGDTRRMFRR